MRTRFGAVLAATGAMACAQPASAAVVVDVDNYAEFPAAMVVGASSFLSASGLLGLELQGFQTWTVGVTGNLVGIDIFGALSGASGSFHLGIFKGGDPTAAGALDSANFLGEASRSFPADSGRMSFDLTALGVRASAGDQLTFRMRVDPCEVPGCWTLFGTAYEGESGEASPAYAGGAMYLKGGVQAPQLQTFDANFRTFMAPVPEPGAWALMILGFGVCGATLRARAAGTRGRFSGRASGLR